MGVLAREHVRGEHPARVEHHERLPGQGAGTASPEFVDTTLGRRQVAAVDDPHAVAGQPGHKAGGHRVDHRSQTRSGVRHQGRRDTNLQPVDLVVERGDRDGERVRHRLVGGVERGLNTRDDHAQQVDDGREKQCLFVPLFGRGPENLVERVRRERVLEGSAYHDADGSSLGEALENRAEEHRRTEPAGTRLSSRKAWRAVRQTPYGGADPLRRLDARGAP